MTNEGLTEPVLRCADCARLVEMKTIKTHGMCLRCGSKKMRRLQTMMEDEMEWLQEHYPEFAEMFEGKEAI